MSAAGRPVSVSKAGLALETENVEVLSRIEKAKIKIASSVESAGLNMLRASVYDYNKVLNSFISSNSSASFEKFVQTVSSSPITLGYKPTVLQLKSNDWKVLYDYLSSITI